MTWNGENIYWQIAEDEEMGKVIILVTPIRFEHNGKEYTVPAGFASDGCSCPRFFWRMLSPALDFVTLIPSVVHDWCYSTGVMGRKEADDLYYDMLVANGFGKIKSKLVWLGVRLGGSSHYNKENER